MLKYQAKVTSIGAQVSEFIDHNILVLFGDQVPDELADFSIMHDGKEIKGPLEVGDVIYFGETSFSVLAIGKIANDNLANLGHLVLKFNGESEPEMPGDVCVDAKPLPAIEPGMVIRIVNLQE